MWKLTEEDAKALLDLATNGSDELNVAIDHLTDEEHFTGFVEGLIWLGVDAVGVFATYKLADAAADKWVNFAHKAIGEFIVTKGK